MNRPVSVFILLAFLCGLTLYIFAQVFLKAQELFCGNEERPIESYDECEQLRLDYLEAHAYQLRYELYRDRVRRAVRERGYKPDPMSIQYLHDMGEGDFDMPQGK